MKSPAQRVISRCAIVALTVVLLAACATPIAFAGDGDDRPVLSWWSDPSTSIAITWFDEPELIRVQIAGPAGRTSEFAIDRDGPVRRTLIDGLEPATTYRYRAERALEDGEAPFTPWRSFTTQPAPSAPADSPASEVNFAVAGDLQPFNEETRRTTSMVMAKLATLEPAFILQMGDVAEYGFSRKSWREAFGTLTVAADEIPVVPAAGNHDHYGVPAARFFKRIFPAPYGAGTETRRNTWYSQSSGPVHVAVLDTEADGRDVERQLEWLEQDLRSARASGSEWLFITMHRPIISSGVFAANPEWVESILPLAARYDVAAIFWGHNHLYEHYEYHYGANGYVLEAGDDVAEAPTHLFTVGTGGARVDPLYTGFLTHRPRTFTVETFDSATGVAEIMEFEQRPWNGKRVYYTAPGTRFQDPARYPDAASYYSWPFENADDARARRYSDDPEITYSDALPFFGYTYGETSVHYLWVEVAGDRCTITAHYPGGSPGEQGPVITSPDGREERWVIER